MILTRLAILALLAVFLSDPGCSVAVHGFILVTTSTRSISRHTSCSKEEPLLQFQRPPIFSNQQHVRGGVLVSSTSLDDNDNDFISLESASDQVLRQALQRDLMDTVTDQQLNQLLQLRDLVVDWNQRINLVSRKDCTPQTVWERHILPSVAIASQHGTTFTNLLLQQQQQQQQSPISVVDVGTGGGFPGLPLAILFPAVQFTLLDSVGKKLAAVQDMADTLQLQNVQTHHGRAEDLRAKKFHIATGRSVASLDSFCAWMHHLLLPIPQTGQLWYWIGGDIDPDIHDRATADVSIASELLPSNDLSPLALDKRILVFSQSAVTQIARESGIVVKPTVPNEPRKRPQRSNNNNNNNNNFKDNKNAKGAWTKKRNDPDRPKERGYDGFQRYSSSSGSPSSDKSV